MLNVAGQRNDDEKSETTERTSDVERGDRKFNSLVVQFKDIYCTWKELR